jgi:ABC-type phosphate transport system substrate-binding protein
VTVARAAGKEPAPGLIDLPVFPQEAQQPRRQKRQAVLAAFAALDPQGIAFVDLVSVPPGNAAIRIVAIGPAGEAVKPNGKTVAEGSYPLSKPLVLCLSPRAGDTAKDFARVILSGACDQMFRQHRFVPAGQPPGHRGQPSHWSPPRRPLSTWSQV